MSCSSRGAPRLRRPPDGTPTLQARSLSKRFGDRVALRDVSFLLERGEILAVIGPNGAGKTTLLSLLAGAAKPSAGEVIAPPGERIGWVPQQTASTRSSRCSRTCACSRGSSASPTRRRGRGDARADRAARACGEQLGRLSGGNRQRVNIAIGLLAQPAVALLDEPSASLDPRQRERLWRFIAARAQAGTSIVFTTHDIAEAERYAARVLVLADGELLFSGSPADLRAAAATSRAPSSARERGH
jgi:ABC-2 type transport system ATP-binding protein